MMIRVMYNDWRQDLVKPAILDQLIGDKKIRMFKRASGWVNVKYDRLRGMGMVQEYRGPERRIEFRAGTEKNAPLH